jgi:hypothetical protein
MLWLLDGDGGSFASSISDSCSSLFRGVSSSGFISADAASLRMQRRDGDAVRVAGVW